MDILDLSRQTQQAAWRILEESGIIPAWENMGAKVNVVGSLKTGLLIHKDIDLHLYTNEITVSDSFRVMAELAGQAAVKEICYKNLIDTEEECIEWHVLYEDENTGTWKFDMIHIRSGSRYDGVVEKTTDAILHKLTPELRRTILQIKYDMPGNAIIPGIEVYHAVFTGHVRSYRELLEWRKENPLTDSLGWLP